MPIVVNLDVMLAKRKMGMTELASRVNITLANLSVLKNNRAKAIRFSTLEAICRELKDVYKRQILRDCSRQAICRRPAEDLWCAPARTLVWLIRR